MHTEYWKILLEAHWSKILATSLDLSQAKRLHLIAEEKGSGEIHRYLSIGNDREDARSVVKRLLNNLAELKLRDCDPQRTSVTGLKGVE